jgi:threonine dehydrogenase-like Zn-dependent dehydrogenase
MESLNMKSVAVVEPNRIDIVDIPKPEPGPYDAVVKTEIAYICNRTDRKLIQGHFPGVDEYPLLLGHETAGIVESIGEKVITYKPGDRAIGGLLLNPTSPEYSSGWGGFSEYILVTDHRAMVNDGITDAEHGWNEIYQIMRVVPENIPVEAAGLLCTWREVYAGCGVFNLRSNDDILVYGAGPVGLSFVKLAKLRGLGWVGSADPHEEKRKIAKTMGADEVFDPNDPEILKLSEKRGKKLDAVIDAVGNEAIINAALPIIKTAGSICVYGVIDKHSIKIEKKLGPYNFYLFVYQWPMRVREAAAQEPLCKWINETKLNHRDFISAEFPIEKINDAIEFVQSGKAIKILLRF